MIIKKCLRCKKRINKEVNINEKMFFCNKCRVFVANPYYKKLNKDEKKIDNNERENEKFQSDERKTISRKR